MDNLTPNPTKSLNRRFVQPHRGYRQFGWNICVMYSRDTPSVCLNDILSSWKGGGGEKEEGVVYRIGPVVCSEQILPWEALLVLVQAQSTIPPFDKLSVIRCNSSGVSRNIRTGLRGGTGYRLRRWRERPGHPRPMVTSISACRETCRKIQYKTPFT